VVFHRNGDRRPAWRWLLSEEDLLLKGHPCKVAFSIVILPFPEFHIRGKCFYHTPLWYI